MALVNIKEMLEKARKEHYAVGAFDASTIEMAMAIVEAAEEEKSPVIVMGLTPALQQGNCQKKQQTMHTNMGQRWRQSLVM